MKPPPLWTYFALPAFGYVVGLLVGNGGGTLGEYVLFFAPNYLVFVAPHLIVLGITKLAHARPIFLHSGLSAATLAYVAVFIAGFFNPFANALEWLWYWPCALALILLSTTTAALWAALKSKNSSA